MRTAKYLHDKIDQLSEEELEKVAAYIRALEEESGRDEGLAIALNRSAEYDAEEVMPVDKATFWKNLSA